MASPLIGEADATGVGGLSTNMGSGDATSMPLVCPTLDFVIASCDQRGGMLGKHVADKSLSSCLSSDHPTREDGGSTHVTIAGDAAVAKCPEVGVSTSCAPVAGNLGAPMLPPSRQRLKTAAVGERQCSSWGLAPAGLGVSPRCKMSRNEYADSARQ
jgi:hypothetical protein